MNEFKSKYTDAVVAKFWVLSRKLLGVTQENHESFSQNTQHPVSDLNSQPPEYEEWVLSTRQQRSVTLPTEYL